MVWFTCDKLLSVPPVFQLAVYEVVEDKEEVNARFGTGTAHVDISATHNKCTALKLWPPSGNMRFGTQPGRWKPSLCCPNSQRLFFFFNM